MKIKKFLLAALLAVVVFAGAAFSAEVENALTPCPEQSAYMVVKLNDTQALLKWLFSKENIDAFMPLILASEDSNDIIGAIEMISAFAENTPLESLALLAGVAGTDAPVPFFRAAFTVKPGLESIFKRVADGSAEAIDIAKLVLGKDNPLASFAETMIKVEKAEDNILKVDNELFLKAQDNIIVAGLSVDDVKASLNALEHSDLRLFGENKPRRLSADDFAWLHIDINALKPLDEDNAIDLEKVAKYLKKPMDAEYAFKRVPGKFLISMAFNLKEALTAEYFDRVFKTRAEKPAVKGGHMNLETSGGVKSPLLVFGSEVYIEGLKQTPEGKEIWDAIVKNAKSYLKLSEEDIANMFTGFVSFALNDNVSVEGIKVPAVYVSQTGQPGAAEKVFTTLESSPHLSKVQDGILQVDSSLSPAPFLIKRDGDTLLINIAEPANMSAKPAVAPGLQKLLDTPATSAMWIDFAGIQSWILAPENGVLIMAEPLARFSGYGEIFDAVKEVLSSKLSVPSMSMYSESVEIIHTEFAIDEDVKAEDGLLTKLVKLGRKFMSFDKVESKPEESK